MTPQQAKQWIEQSSATRKLLDDLGLPSNPQPGSLDEMEVVMIAEGMKKSWMIGYAEGCGYKNNHSGKNQSFTLQPPSQ